MRRLVLVALSAGVLCSCGGSGGGHEAGGGPTAPPPSAAAQVQGTWAGTTSGTLLHGPACARDPIPTPTRAVITQTGAGIALQVTLNSAITCSHHGTVGETAIGWTLDQTQTNPDCLGLRRLPCLSPDGSIRFIDTRNRSGDLTGTVTGNQISVSGIGITDVFDSATGQAIDTIQASIQVKLQKQ
jgi:hypothetical protein